MFEEMFYVSPDLRPVGQDILLAKFLTPSGCEYIRACVEGASTWTTNTRDHDYFTQDLHLDLHVPEIYKMLEEQLNDVIFPASVEYWDCCSAVVKNLFAIKYSLDTQVGLKVHHDDSYITGSVKINNDYQGALLHFPDKKFTNEDIEIGDILIWPSQITHRHGCTDLESGTKYALTIWTDQCTEL
tara:strand:+ start:106 stop:660 length:555 start_codon:yes stop_codon:yes gene_type:complete